MLGHFRTLHAATAAALFANLASATLVHSLPSCPEGMETTWTTPANASFAICSGTDYQLGGVSLQLVEDVDCTRACLGICHDDDRCSYAVYDKEDRICHVKDTANAADMIWAVDERFDSIRRLDGSTWPPSEDPDVGGGSGGGVGGGNNGTVPTPPLNNGTTTTPLKEGSFLASCPADQSEFAAANGAKLRVCPGTDYVGASAKIVEGVASTEACAELCSTTEDCRKAVFDSEQHVCHIKAAEPANSLFWVKNKRFTTITTPDATTEAVTSHSKSGRWSDIIRLPLIPVAAYVVPQSPSPSKLLFFSSWGVDAFGGASGMTQFGSFNFVSGEIGHREITNTHHDMFCPAMSALADGRMLVQGGSDAEAVSVYDPATDAFTRGPDLKLPRGYQTSTILSDGRVFTIGGAYSGPREAKEGEVFDPSTNEWTLLPGADPKPLLTVDHEGIWREDNHAWLFGWRNGSVFQAGPSMDQHWYGTEGEGSVVKAGTRDPEQHAMCGVWAMYDATAGKILSAGGAPDYTEADANNRAHITTISEPDSPSEVERVSDMAFPRAFANAAVLPDGTVLVTGGQRRALVFTNTAGILIPELFDPVAKTWTQLAPAAVPRNYHSVSILLPDATVFVGGGGLCYVAKVKGSSANCDKSVDHADGEIFEPPYLFKEDGSRAARPEISGLPDAPVRAGETLSFEVQMEEGGAGEEGAFEFALVRIGSVTHSVNSDQRRVPLAGARVGADGKVEVELPADSGVLLPGFWYLFAMSPSGTPSVAKTVQVVL